MVKFNHLVICGLLAALGSAMMDYTLADSTLNLTTSNIDEVLNQQEYTLVTMIQPWCRYCVQFESEFQKLEQTFANDKDISVGYVNLLFNDELHQRFAIRHLPSLFLFYKNQIIGFFQGHKNAEEISQWTRDLVIKHMHIQEHALSQISSGESQQQPELLSLVQSYSQNALSTTNRVVLAQVRAKTDTQVVILDRENYKDVIFDQNNDIFVKFYATWCPHCTAIRDEWEKLAEAFNSNPDNGVIIAEMEDREIPSELEINAFPNLRLFNSNDKVNSIKSQVPRDLASWKTFLKENSPRYQEYLKTHPEI